VLRQFKRVHRDAVVNTCSRLSPIVDSDKSGRAFELRGKAPSFWSDEMWFREN